MATTSSATAAALISGFWSYVATSFGDGIFAVRGEELFAPPLKK
jgi:hypothetical protein